MNDALVNGEIAAFVSTSDRGFCYGDGLFETMAVVGGRPRFWQAHMDRLDEGCRRLSLDSPAQATLLREVQTVAAGQPRCVVRITLSRKPAGRGYASGGERATNRVVSSHDWPQDLADSQELGVEARTLALRLAQQPALGGIKHLNRLEQVLGSLELAETPALEGIFLDRDGHIISALSANLFLVSDGNLMTPRMDRCGVRGVVRGLILRDFKPRCELRRIMPDMLVETNEAFLCNAVRGIVPLRGIDELSWPIGPVTRELQAWFKRRAEAA